MKFYSIILIIISTTFCFSNSIFAQSSAEIQWGYFQENSYIQGESVYFNVQVKNTGSTTLSGLWLNVDISNPNGTNVREGWWQYIPTLSPNQTYYTGYDYVWSVSTNAMLGNYSATVGLRDASTMYDIVYQIDNFTVIQSNPNAEIQWGYTDTYSYELGETVEFNVKVKNIGNVTLTGLWLNVDIASPSGSNVVEGFWQNIPTLDPNETYETGYDDLWDIPYDANSGEYSITVGLRDNSMIYDIEYGIDQFYIEPGTASAEILWGYIENDFYFSGEIVRLNVKVINTGNTILDDLWLNVDISDPSGTNVREGWWQYIPTLDPNESYETGYDDVWKIPVGAAIGVYSVTLGLRDNSTIYDIEYGIDQFYVDEIPEPFPISDGKIVFHSYSDYGAWDGKLYFYDFSEQLLVEISENWNIDHTINAHFSPDGSKIVFMGVPEGSHYYNSWDIFLWELGYDTPINLTYNNIPDEDPKFSPSGGEIVFKQNGDLKIMNLNGTIIYTITNDGFSVEESMPYYTNDAQQIIYSRGAGSDSDIYIINVNGSNNQPLENVANIQEYYPITRDLYTFLFTRWVSYSNHHDQIYLGYFSGASSQSLVFNNDNADDSDPFPVDSDYVFFSSNRSGSVGGWDLYLADINSGLVWSMSDFGINSSNHELGVCYTSNSVSIGDNNLEIPCRLKLYQNCPNPFNPETTISFSIPKDSEVEISIYNVQGQRIKKLANENFQSGYYKVLWDGKDENGKSVSSGIYFYKIETDKFSEIKRCILLD